MEDRPLNAWFDKDKRTIFSHIYGEEEILPVSTEEGNEKSRRNKEEVKQVVSLYNSIFASQYKSSLIAFILLICKGRSKHNVH